MRIIKFIFFSILLLVAVALVVAFFVDGNIKYEKTIIIEAPSDKVWSYVNTLAANNQWSPWIDKDPDMKTTVDGIDGKPGARFCWDSDRSEVGKGCQIITLVKPNELFETELKFVTPYESEAISYIKLKNVDTGVSTTWGFSGVMPYPIKILKLFTSIEEMIGRDYERGLNKLKKLCEAP